MAQPLEQFAKSLLASSLPFAGEFEAWLRGLPKEKRPADGEQCARVLVKEKKLTAYQAQEIYAGRGKKLVLGNYVIADKLGQGGMGVVLKAEHTRMGRLVAIKVMSAAGMKNPDAVKRFQREVQAAAKLTHQNIVTAFDADEAGGQHFLVMEYVEGSDLSQLVKKNGPMSIEKALHCILQAARGLEFAHSKGVVHRDIKPANLLLDSEGMIKILDMGLARLEHSPEQAELTGTGQVMGTVDYMAPEQAMSTKSADSRADIYSLGITLWYLLTGRVAYEGDTLMAKLMAHSTAPIPYLASVNMAVPPSLDAVFRRMIAKTPPERFQSMTEVIAALEGSRSGNVVSPTIQVPKSEDSKLSEFLKGMGPGASPGRSGIGLASPQAVATAPPPLAGSTNASFEQTIDTGNPQTDTDPQADQSLVAPPAPSRPAAPTAPAKPWHADWRVWTFGSGGLGVLVLIALIVVLLRSAPPGPPPPKNTGGKGPPAAPGATSSGPPAAGDLALEFDGSGEGKMVGIRLDLSQPLTLEGYMVVTGPSAPGGWPAALYAGNRIALTNDGGNWGFRIIGGEDLKLPHQINDKRPIELGRRYHVAGVSTGKRMILFIDGKLVAEKNLDADPPARVVTDLNLAFKFVGRLDELRASQSARYVADFTPPGRLATDAQTLGLYHCDEGSGTTLKDSSGGGHDGVLTKVKWVAGLVPTAGAGGPAGGPATAAVSRPGLAFSSPTDYVQANLAPSIVRPPLTVEVIATIHRQDRIVDLVQIGDAGQAIRLRYSPTLNFGFTAAGAPGWAGIGSKPPPADKPVHLAGIWTDVAFRAYLDGSEIGAISNTTGLAPLPTLLLGGSPSGKAEQGSATVTFHAVRISKTARNPATFAPTADLRTDADTIALYRFAEGQGEQLQDGSGGNHHGRIVGAKWAAAAAPPATAPAAATGIWRPLFNGKNLAGWTQVLDQSKSWRVQNGELFCRNGTEINHLVSADSFADFDLLAEVLVTPGGNSGIFFRTTGSQIDDGHEVEIGANVGFSTGQMVGAPQHPSVPVQDGQWTTVELIVRGSRFLTKVNGRFIDDWTDPTVPPSGKIALQCLTTNTEVRFRRIDIRPAP